MSRYIQDVYLGLPTDFVEFMMNDYLGKNSFSQKTWKGMPVNIRAYGFFEGFRFMVWSYSDGRFHLEAWFRGPFGGEQSLSGLWGWAAKTAYRKEIDKLIELLRKLSNPSAFGDAASNSSTPMQPITVQTTLDNRGSAILSLVFGLASIILPIVLDYLPDTVLDRNGFYWLPALASNGLMFWPYSMFFTYFVSLFFGRLAVIFYRSGKNSTKANLAKCGLAFAIIGMLFPLLLYLGTLLLLIFLCLAAYGKLP